MKRRPHASAVRDAVDGRFVPDSEAEADPERTVRERRRRLVYLLPRELMASDGQGAGVWVLVLRQGKRTTELCNHAWHESAQSAWLCAMAHARLAEGV